MTNSLKPYLILIFTTLAITFVVWLPHLLQLPKILGLDFSPGFNSIYRNFDGIEYIIIAKSAYIPSEIIKLPQSLPDIYYAAHFPGFALIIWLIAPIFGFLKAMLFGSLFFTILSVLCFYKLVSEFKLSSQPLWLSILFLILPARWLIVHSVGSAEPMFICFTILAIYSFMKFEMNYASRWIWLAGIFGAVAQLTRPPGILLFMALGIYLLWKIVKTREKPWKIFRYYPLALIPIMLLAIFGYYSFSYGDFWAYFHTGDNIHLGFPPFKVFNQAESWVGEIWLEDIVYIYLFGYFGGLWLFRQKLGVMGSYVLTYTVAASLVAHRDISRYILPIFPFVLIAFEKILVTKEMKITLAILALAIYLYAQNFLIANVAPFPNLEYFN